MGLTVLSVAYPLTPVGLDAAGGSEQILTLLDRKLTRDGHNSIVVAVAGSKVDGTLVASPEYRGQLNDSVRRWAAQQHHKIITQVLERVPVDLVHMHSLDFHQYLPETPVPLLATLHLPPSWYPKHVFSLQRPHTYLNCVSRSQCRACPPSSLLVETVPNGIEVETFQRKAQKNGYALAIGRICPEKGFHLALDAAKEAGIGLLLAGQIFPYKAHQEYFDNEIAPRLDERREIIGPAGFEKKRALLSKARCLLVTSSVPETSSLVAMEALASGTPVIAFPVGALPDLIDHGRTGFLVKNVAEMAVPSKRWVHWTTNTAVRWRGNASVVNV